MEPLLQACTFEATTLDLTGVDGSRYQVTGYHAFRDGKSVGLGYWVDIPEPSSIEMVLNGKNIRIPRTWEDLRPRCIIIHLASGCSFPYWLPSEPLTQALLTEVSAVLDWTLLLDELVKQPQWAEIGIICQKAIARLSSSSAS
jgi:hypothetical protein